MGFLKILENKKEKLIKIITKRMRIEIQFNSVVVDPQDTQEYFPGLMSMINSSLPIQKKVKRRKRKAKETVGPLIQEIIDSIDK